MSLGVEPEVAEVREGSRNDHAGNATDGAPESAQLGPRTAAVTVLPVKVKSSIVPEEALYTYMPFCVLSWIVLSVKVKSVIFVFFFIYKKNIPLKIPTDQKKAHKSINLLAHLAFALDAKPMN